MRSPQSIRSLPPVETTLATLATASKIAFDFPERRACTVAIRKTRPNTKRTSIKAGIRFGAMGAGPDLAGRITYIPNC